MNKSLIACILLVFLSFSLLTACGKSNGAITPEEAQQAAFADAGVTADQASAIHVHIMDKDGIPCYSVHFSANGRDYSVLIHAGDGSIVGYDH